jgi:capsid protein
VIRQLRRRLGRSIAALAGWLGGYQSTDPTRLLIQGWKPQAQTANQALAPTLSTLVAQCRQLERTCPQARAVAEALRADVVGSGIDVHLLNITDEIDAGKVMAGWHAWADHCGVNGESLWELQGMAVAELASAGASLWRWIPDKGYRYGLRILPLGIEWLAENQIDAVPADLTFVRGVLIDRLGRPVAYDIKQPDSLLPGERVPAAQIIHCFEPRRALQAHGEPILAPVVERLYQANELVSIELASARKASAMAVAITAEQQLDQVDDDDKPVQDIPIAATVRLNQGESVEVISSDRPSQAINAFLDVIRGEIAAACRVSRWMLDRDSTKTSYAAGRLDQLIGKRLLGPVKAVVGRHLAGRPAEVIMPLVLLSLRMPMPAGGLRYDLRPDEPEYVDPVKDAEGIAKQLENRTTTLEKACADRGLDWRQVLAQQAAEQQVMRDLGLNQPAVISPQAQPA